MSAIRNWPTTLIWQEGAEIFVRVDTGTRLQRALYRVPGREWDDTRRANVMPATELDRVVTLLEKYPDDTGLRTVPRESVGDWPVEIVWREDDLLFVRTPYNSPLHWAINKIKGRVWSQSRNAHRLRAQDQPRVEKLLAEHLEAPDTDTTTAWAQKADTKAHRSHQVQAGLWVRLDPWEKLGQAIAREWGGRWDRDEQLWLVPTAADRRRVMTEVTRSRRLREAAYADAREAWLNASAGKVLASTSRDVLHVEDVKELVGFVPDQRFGDVSSSIVPGDTMWADETLWLVTGVHWVEEYMADDGEFVPRGWRGTFRVVEVLHTEQEWRDHQSAADVP